MHSECSRNTGLRYVDGTTCERGPSLTQSASMSSAVGSPAKTSATLEKEQVSLGSEADCSINSPESFASWDQESLCWRTSQRCLIEGWETFSGRWPRSGSMRNGIAYRQKPLAPRTKETGFFLLPSPVAMAGSKANSAVMSLTPAMKFRETKYGVPRKVSNQGVDGSVGLWRLVVLWTGKMPTAGFVEWMMGFPKKWTDLGASETQ